MELSPRSDIKSFVLDKVGTGLIKLGWGQFNGTIYSSAAESSG